MTKAGTVATDLYTIAKTVTAWEESQFVEPKHDPAELSSHPDSLFLLIYSRGLSQCRGPFESVSSAKTEQSSNWMSNKQESVNINAKRHSPGSCEEDSLLAYSAKSEQFTQSFVWHQIIVRSKESEVFVLSS